ncbi:hypothetical protein [Aliivibrio fischeri]|uniref:HTH cro/C1-type domain-containing protein n=1 Tax=Aliivibrio fischeri SR5 TaxID=1088719 RepID=A0AAV3EM11_ALIFS|nr:hypothetical protein [Aliivibrio fischeri]EHN67997.1 hypothetical protein VFSR5_2722 [Aliivibrio fischeri SR5]
MNDNIIWAVASVIFSGCATPFLRPLWDKLSKKSSVISSAELESRPEILPIESKELNYREKLGIRHRELRLNLAGFTLAQMSEIYSLEEASKIEEYESGEQELPKKLMNVANKYFNLKSEYFDPEIEELFPFRSISSSEYEFYLAKGYKPYIMCSPNEREWNLFAYIYFYYEKNGLHQMVKSNEIARFKSGDTGKHNVERLIYNMKLMGYDQNYAVVAKVNKENWELMENNRFFKKITPYSIDVECMDIFDKWFNSYKK